MVLRLCPGLVAAAVLLGAGAGCAPVKPNVFFTGFGVADPVRDQSIVERYRARARLEPPPPPSDVVVVIDTIPAGLQVDRGTLTVLPGYRHQIVGKFRLAGAFGGFWTQYRARWRRGYCNPQLPLAVVTLGLWPFYWPCFTGSSLKTDLVEDLKQVAAAAGGDLVIASWEGPTQDRANGARGFVLRMDPRVRAQVAAPPPVRARPIEPMSDRPTGSL